MTREKTDFWVGLFVLLGAIALVFLALRAGNMSSFSFAPTYQVQAHFDNMGGLKVRAPVKSSGVVVRSEEHTSELQSLMRISYAVFCLKKTTKQTHNIKQHKSERQNY